MASKIQVPVDFKARDYQVSVWNKIKSKETKRAICVWHRRAGKDILAINLIATEMFRRPGIYWHILPTYAQGRKAIWNGMTNDGRKFLDFIPKEAVATRRNDEMRLELHSSLGGSVYQVIGGDNPDRIVGGNPIGVVFSEYSLMNPVCWDLIRPILNANDGWALFVYTPRGDNHGLELINRARELESWYVETLSVDDTRKPDGTRLVTKEMIDEDIAMGMPEELAQQEYYVSFSAAMVGAYYGAALETAEKEKRICALRWERDERVNTCWDLGIRDTMSIWFYQIIGGWVHWIDYYAASGEGIEHYAKELDKKPYVYKTHYAPHDVMKREIGTGTSIKDTAARLGLRFTVVPKGNVEDGINASRLTIAKSFFDREKCEDGLKALRSYRKEWDLKNRVWSAKPLHDWTSHPADAFRTGAMVMPSISPIIKEAPRYAQDTTFSELMVHHDGMMRDKKNRQGWSRL